MYRGPRTPFAPSPYSSPVQVPCDLRTSPSIFLRSHAWPKQERDAFNNAVLNTQAHIARNTYFVPLDGMLHPTQAIQSGMTALSQAERRMAQLQHAAVRKHMAGMPLTAQEAREIMSLRAPQRPRYSAIARGEARAAGVRPLTARQLPPYVVNHMPPAVMKMRAALQDPMGRLINERTIVSRTRTVAELMSYQVRGVLKGRL